MAERVTYDWEAAASSCGPMAEGARREAFSTVRVRIRQETGAHYHETSNELYRVEEGRGCLRTRHRETGTEAEYDLRPGTEILIEPDEIHQTRPDGELVVTSVSAPAWSEDDEFVSEALF